MTTFTGYNPTARTIQPSSPCAAPPPCPACGGLECLCRPRFFAGQVLTEGDLNRLEGYFVKKNRLHNRYLHGWGTVCGLEVVCSPCSDRVTVKAGYALSPCGDDIILCADATASICDLIRKCQPATQAAMNCLPPAIGADNGCKDLVEDWVLAVCYNETTSRGITPLRGGSSSGNCACGGSGGSGCGCGCHSSSPTSNGANGCKPSPRTPSPQCEPTLTCEGYTFSVYPLPPAKQPAGDNTSQPISSQLGNRILACITCMMQNAPNRPAAQSSAAQLQQYCCAVKKWLTSLLAMFAPTNCQLSQALASVQCPDAAQITDPAAYQKALDDQVTPTYGLVFGELIRGCICDALLPPCPGPADCNCVPLATVSVRKKDCTVMKVCNWGPRKFVMTFPDLLYWTEWTGIFQLLRQGIEALCCGPFGEQRAQLTTTMELQQQPAQPEFADRSHVKVTPFARLFSQSWLNQDRPVDARALGLAMLGATDTAGKPLATPLEMKNPGAFLAINQMLRPAVQATMPPEISSLLTALAKGGSTGFDAAVNVAGAAPAAAAPQAPAAPAAAAPAADDLAALRKTVTNLQATVEQLRKQVSSRPPGKP